MAEEINARLVGTEFVRHYYTMLNERPDCLHLFFTQNSSYVHGGIERPGEELPPVRGQSAIRDKIASLQFNDCRTKVLQVDAQETIGNAVLVQVSGELSNNGEPMRRFMQSFVLVPQSPKNFYVHNDIFRYQDEVFADGENLSDDQCEGSNLVVDETDEVTNGVVEETEVVVPPVSTEVQPESQINDVLENSMAAVEPMPLAPEVSQQVNALEEHQVNAMVVPVNENAAGAYVEKEDEQDTKKEPEKEMLPPVVPSQKPFSWASLASKPQAAIKPERKTESEPAQAPLPQRTPRPARPELSINEGDKKWVPGPAEETVGKRSNYPDNQQLFVGNLPHSVTDKELQDFFESFGPVLDVKINRKGPATHLPNFGFVAFESTESVQKAMKAKPLMLHGKYRINIEEKKDHSELSGRTRINIRGRGGNYGRGGYINRGGRGNHTARSASGESPSADIQQ